ncbi:non-ribosomal peptide synthase/polyketide synthase [Nocardia sp. NPDC127526]|uniref:non-ribosomal peptide synthase/polyketide synthase n=1 Tax=Nocardia sp. NPDC127526 TaxID=3345393 RepID=UPI0036372AA5
MRGTELGGMGPGGAGDQAKDQRLHHDTDESFPLTPAQLGLWYAQLLEPDVPINVAQYLDVRGDLDLAVLERAHLDALCEFEAVQMRLVECDGQPRQVLDPGQPVRIPLIDLRAAADPIAAAQDWMRADYTAPVDLLRDRHFAGAVLRVGEQRWFWYLRTHHLMLDGYGALTNTMRIAELYNARMRGTPPSDIAPGSMRELVAAEAEYRDSARFTEDREYWAERVRGLEATTLVRRVAGAAPANLRFGRQLPRRLLDRLKEVAAEGNSKVATVVLAAFAAYLARLTDRDEVVLSLPVTARTDALTRRSAGMLSNIVPLRIAVGADLTWGALLAATGAELSAALRHQRYRHEDIRRDADRAGQQTRRALFGPLVNIMLFDLSLPLADAQARYHVLTTGPVEDLSLQLYHAGAEQVVLELEANPNLYGGDDIARHHARFVGFLERLLAADPGTPVAGVRAATELEREVSLRIWNDTGRELGGGTLVSMFAEQAARTPERAALSSPDSGCELTYAELSERVNRLARHLISLGIGPEDLVALQLPRSPELVVAIYAVQAAGAAYVPLDPGHPAERTAHIMTTARPVCVLTTRGLFEVDSRRHPGALLGRDPHGAGDAASADSGQTHAGTTGAVLCVDGLDLSGYSGAPVGDAERIAPLRPANTAYVIFTSGSTGRPKGVAVSHAAIVNRLRWMQAEYRLTADDVVLQKTPSTFDVSVWEFFWPLQVGARLVLATPEGHRDPVYLADLMVRTGVTVAHFVPSMLSIFADELAAAKAMETMALRMLFASGEVLPAATAQRLRALTRAALHNLYGPTEAAVDVTFHEVTDLDIAGVPIGAPVSNTRLYVLDSRLRPVPIGTPGELYLSGVQLARGYVARPALTAERFVADPFAGAEGHGHPGSSMYRTGDLVCWSATGELLYLDRTDFQVKLRGLRIELGEIETVLSAVEGVRRCVVVVREDQLVAYVVPAAIAAPAERVADAVAAQGVAADAVAAQGDAADAAATQGVAAKVAAAKGIAAGAAAGQNASMEDIAGPIAAARVAGEQAATAVVVDAARLRSAAAAALPAYMVPSAYVLLEALPLNASGKLDRAALPAPQRAAVEYREPESVVERAVARIFGEVLQCDGIGLDDDFFALGGNSLIATQVAARLGAELGCRLGVRELFAATTVAELAALIGDRFLDEDAEAGPALEVRPRPEVLPLSPAQQRIWFLNRFERSSAGYNMPFVLHLRGVLEVDALRAALTDVLARHEVLRTVFPQSADGTAHQRILRPDEVSPLGPVESLIAAAVLLSGNESPASILPDSLRGVVDSSAARNDSSARVADDFAVRVVGSSAAGAADDSAAGVVDGSAARVGDDFAAREADSTAPPVADGTAALVAAALEGELREFAAAGFDLQSEIPFRARLFQVGDDEYALAVVLHHIAADGLSLRVLARDLAEAYGARREGRGPGWVGLPVQYADYALWQRERLGAAEDPESLLGRQLEFWTDALFGAPEQIDLPADRARPPVASGRGGVHTIELPAELHARIADTARAQGVSTFMLVHATLAVLLSRLSGSADVVIGTPVGGRGARELDELIGMFVNTLPLRTRVDARAPFTRLLAQVREADLAAFAHADAPFEQLVEVLNPARSQARHPVFQVMLAFTGAGNIGVELPGLLATAGTLDTGVTKFDLSVAVTESFAGAGPGEGPAPAGIQAEFSFALDLFSRATIAEYATWFVRLLDAVGTAPQTLVAELPLLAADERRRVLESGAAPALPAATGVRTVVAAFEEQVRRAPGAVAVIDGPWLLTYGEMSAHVNRLARLLVSLGVGPDALVVLGMRRSAEFVLAAYAVLTAGGAYVPVDPDQPAARLRHVIETAQPVCILTTSADGWRADADARGDGERIRVVAVDTAELSGFAADPVADDERGGPLHPDALAYVIFTSGSTGRPKGVAVRHCSVANQIDWIAAEYGIDRDEVVLFKTPATFDVSVWELFAPLCRGGRLVVAEHDGHRDTAYLAETIALYGVTMTSFVPSMLAVFASAARADELASLRAVLVAGEAMTSEAAAGFATVSRAELHNLYGPTEFTVHATHAPVDPEGTGPVPIGRPVAGNRVYVLDERLQPVPDTVIGELYLSGVQLARGYHGRADLSAERFVANPYGPAGSRMYRTGDLVRRTRGGVLEYLGRSDFQVKLRGQRIELGDIEAALTAAADVRAAAVTVHKHHSGELLVAYVVTDLPEAELTDILGDRVRAALPSYMVPTAYVRLDYMPLTASGKLDRKALPEPELRARAFRAPATRAERAVTRVFAEVLGVDRVGLDDDFFALGGNSLVATQISARLADVLAADVPVRALFEYPTVAGLADRLRRGAAEYRKPLVARVRADRRADPVPLSYAQQRMWFLNRFDSASVADNLVAAIRLSGPLDQAALAAAFADVVERHEALRTVYPAVDGIGYQRVLPVSAVGLDLTPEAIGADLLDERIQALAARPFAVSEEVPLRLALLRVAADDRGGEEHVLVFAVHHIAADGWSIAPLTRDLMSAYAARRAGDAPQWEPLPVQYTDYTLWQRELLGSADDPESLLSRQLGFWRDELSGLAPELPLPADRPRPASVSGRGAAHGFTLDASLHRSLLELAERNQASLFMVVHAAFAALLSKLSAQQDISIGTPVAGRGEQALDGLVGMFVNTLALRTEVLPRQSFAALVAAVREADLRAFAHADVPFERLVEALAPVRSPGLHPLFQVVLDFQNTAQAELELAGLAVSRLNIDTRTAKFDLQLSVREHSGAAGETGALDAVFTYATDLFDAETIAVLTERFERVLRAVAADPMIAVDDIEVLTAGERQRVLHDWPVTGADIAENTTVAARFATAARIDPQAIAVRAGDVTLTYAELDSRANRLARRLIAAGVGPESLVAVALPRSVELVVALLAVVQAGGGYLPIDPNYPADRIEYVLDDARPVCAVTNAAAQLPAAWFDGTVIDLDTVDLAGYPEGPITDRDRRSPLDPAHTAYVIYTSGSTGRPKGVVIPHRNVIRLLDNTHDRFGFDASDVWTLFHSYAFDFSVWELWGALLYGGRVVVVDYFTSRSPRQFRELLAAERVTVLNQTPSAFYQLVAADTEAHGELALRYVIFGGEALEPQRLRGWFARHPQAPALVNMYGITETTVHVSYRSMAPGTGAASVIGGPLPGLTVRVLDARLRPVPVGVPGEIYVSGGQLARGYLARPALSASRFVADPHGPAGSRAYRSGDLARWTSGGELEYLGRADQQVNLRGFRIELGEIEAALLAEATVREAAVVVRHDGLVDEDRIVGYVVPAERDAAPDTGVLRQALTGRLPEHMVPAAIVLVERIPLTVNGKLDRAALPAPVFGTVAYRAPGAPAEVAVAEVYAELLGVARVGLDDDFFALGGSSLLAARAAARIGAALDCDLPVRALFEARTVAALANYAQASTGAGGRLPLRAMDPRPQRIPLAAAQRRMWFLNRYWATEDSAGPGAAADNIPLVIRFSGDLDEAALRSALADLVARHETLRTVHPDGPDGPEQVILAAAEQVPALAAEPIAASDLPARLAAAAAEPFDLTVETPLRAALFTVSPTEHALVLVLHHIGADGYSLGPLARDLMTAYTARHAGQAPGWEPLPVQYADYTLWQAETLGADDDPETVAHRQLAYWRDRLAGLPEQLDLPADRPRPAVSSHRGGTHRLAVDSDLHGELTELARKQDTTLFSTVHAALAVLLSRLSGSADIAIGTPVAGRGEQALDGLVGMFVNTLVLRTEVDPRAGFDTVLDMVRADDIAALSHADVPFERLVEVLAPARSQHRHPLFQVGLTFQNFPLPALELPGLRIRPEQIDAGVAKFDLQFTVTEVVGADGRAGGMDVEITYARDLFDAGSIAVLARRFEQVLAAVAADRTVAVGDIQLLSAEEQRRGLYEWPVGDADIAETVTIAERFATAARIDPEAVAVRAGEITLTYPELDARSNRLARRLIAAGAGPEALVCVALPRTADVVVALLAVLKSGSGYLPIDPNYPADRIEYVLDDARPVCAVTSAAAQLPAGWFGGPVIDLDTAELSGFSDAPVTDADRRGALRPENTAYVIYTSGSTGRPKGVMVPHSNVIRLLDNTHREYGFGPSDVWTLFHSYAFDFSVWELWGALLYGGRIVVVDYLTSRSPQQFLELLAAERVTVLNQTPSAFYQLISADAESHPELALRVVIFGGEALEPNRLRGWFARRPQRPVLVNMYGITETTVHASYRAVGPEDGSASAIGGALAGLTLRLLDSRLRPVPVGVPGEIYVSGGQLARGYFARPALSAGRFVADPYGPAGSRTYRSGDLARWTADGELEYLGRADQQVNLRGFRVELGEIEQALLEQPGVRQAAVAVRRDAAVDEDRIVGYVVAGAADVDTAALRQAVARRLPEHMVPAALVLLDRIPLTVNGKLDRAALPDPVFETAVYRRPATLAEEIVAGVFAELLGLDRVGSDDDFFALGGSSLLAAKAVARIGGVLGATVGVRALFESSRVRELAARIGAGAESARPPLVAGERPDRLPLSPAQQRMWFLNRFDRTSTAYTIPLALRLRSASGALDVEALRAAVGDVIGRHETLRTVYPETANGPAQVILPAEDAAQPLIPVDITEAELPQRMLDLVAAGFDVTTEVPVRLRLFRITDTDPSEHVFAAALHHISADGSSIVPFVRDLIHAYGARLAGEAPVWSPLAAQYADYALWQRTLLGSEDDAESVAAQQIAYWSNALAGLPEQLDLPTDYPRPARQSLRGTHVDFPIDAELHARLAEVGRRRGATLFMVVHAAFAALLARLSGSADIAVGTPIAGRGEAALDDIIGMFVNTLVLRTGIDPAEPFTDLLDRVRTTDIAAFAHADVPFERLVEVLNPARSTARHPLFQVGLSFQNHARATLHLPGLDISDIEFDNDTAQFDLHLFAIDHYSDTGAPTGVDLTLRYATDLFTAATAARFADALRRVLETIAAEPETRIGAIDLLGGELRHRMLVEWNDTTHPVPGHTLADLVDAQVASTPAAPALVIPAGSRPEPRGGSRPQPRRDDGGCEVLTYAEFDARVNRLARWLIAGGVGPERTVALAMRRSVELVVAMYAVVKAGGAYVPIDPDHPADRIAYVLETAAPVCVLTTSRDGFEVDSHRHPGALLGRDPHDVVDFGAGVDSGQKHAGMTGQVLRVDELDLTGYSGAPIADGERVCPLRAAHPAYVIFTSGSTGAPKGVAVPHSAIVNQLQWLRTTFGLGPADRALLKTPATFDLSVWEFWSPLVTGGGLVVSAAGDERDPDRLRELMSAYGVTVLHPVPSLLGMLLTAGPLPASVRAVLTIGEALPAATAAEFLDRHPSGSESAAGLFNLYGPTEAAVSITAYEVRQPPAHTVPIGTPAWNSRCYVLDARLQPVPVGVPGELYLSGAQLARGYHAHAARTAERFVADPFHPAGAEADGRMYRTGDIVRWRADSSLEYLDRADFQVKVGGHRIELGEIETVLRRQEGVTAAVAVARTGAAGARLVAYAAVPDAEPERYDEVAAELRAALVAGLPQYMVPAAIVVLDALPLNANGKVDRPRLPEPVFAAAVHREPVTRLERLVAAAFAEVAELADVPGLDSDFFALGGNSLMATRLVARLGADLGVHVPVAAVFEAPTVAGLAERLASADARDARPVPVRRSTTGPAALSLAQQRMWVVNRLHPDSTAYHVPAAIRLTGALDRDALHAALLDVLGRHDILRTRFPEVDGEPVQQVLPVTDLRLDLEPVPDDGRDIEQRIADIMAAGFDVTAEPPVRVRLLVDGAEAHVLVVVLHHIAADGYSVTPMTRDLVLAYTSRARGDVPAWEPLPIQYADYSDWQRQVLGDDNDPRSVLSRQLAFWTDELAGVPDHLPLPTDRPRPARRDMRGATVDCEIGADLTSNLVAVARAHETTLFGVLHAGFAVLLSKLSGLHDIAVGTPVAGRGDRALDDMIGMFVNTVVLRTDIDARAPFHDLLRQVRDRDLAALAHADVPFERVVEAVLSGSGRSRSSAHTPLFQVLFTYQNMPAGAIALPGLAVEVLEPRPAEAKFDLQLTAVEQYGEHGRVTGLRMQFTYATDIFDAETVRRCAERLVRVLETVAADPAITVRAIDIRTAAEQSGPARSATGGAADVAPADLPALIAAAAELTPDAIAVRHGDHIVSYRDLATKIAAVARSMGAAAKPEALVNVALAGLVPGILAALGAGGLSEVLRTLSGEAQAVVLRSDLESEGAL